jgi:hypothetical protein
MSVIIAVKLDTTPPAAPNTNLTMTEECTEQLKLL